MDGTTARQQAPLTNIRVVALEQAVAAPLCSRHLADLGADIFKIERPGRGDFARHYDSVVHGESAYFVWLNRGKRSVEIDLNSDAGREVLDALLGTADIFLHNLGPGVLHRLGYGWTRLHDRWPRLISCAISGYGQAGPASGLKAFDLLVQGESGLASVTGSADEPAKVGISIADISAGMYALAAILAALIKRTTSGLGEFLDVSMLDCLAEWMSVPALYQRYTESPPPRTGLHHATIAPYGPYRAQEGPPILFAVQSTDQWSRFCAFVLQKPELAVDPRFSTNEQRVRNREALDKLIRAAVAQTDRATLIARLTAADIPHAPVNDVAGLLAHPQLTERNRWIEVETSTGPVVTIASPLGSAAARAVPELGADTRAVRLELGFDAQPDD